MVRPHAVVAAIDDDAGRAADPVGKRPPDQTADRAHDAERAEDQRRQRQLGKGQCKRYASHLCFTAPSFSLMRGKSMITLCV